MFFLLLLIHVFTAFAYKIDASCSNAGIEQDLRSAMTSAFEMVDSAINKLSDNTMSGPTKDLVRNLFTKDGQDPNSTNMGNVFSVLNRVRRFYRQEVTGDVDLDDIILFCDLTRFQKLDDQRWGDDAWRDTSNSVVVNVKHLDCQGDSVLDRIALAMTTNPGLSTLVSSNSDPDNYQWTTLPQTSQIQICPWFVDWIKSKEYRTQDDLVKRTNFGRMVVKFAEKGTIFTPIDALNLLDKVLLHEMTHGRIVYFNDWENNEPGSEEEWQSAQLGLDDVAIPAEGLFFLWRKFKIPAYGWKLAKRLVKYGQATGSNFPDTPDNNADSVALFASACKLMDDSWPKRVTDEGNVVPDV